MVPRPRQLDKAATSPASPAPTNIPQFSSIKQSIALGLGGFGEAMAALFPPLRNVWTIPPQEGQTVGQAWFKLIEATPAAERSATVIGLINNLPKIAALGVTAIVLFPRIGATVTYLRTVRARRRGLIIAPPAAPTFPTAAEPAGTVDVAGDYVAATAEQYREADPGDGYAAAAPAAATRGEGALCGNGYAGERNGEYATIDGTEAK